MSCFSLGGQSVAANVTNILHIPVAQPCRQHFMRQCCSGWTVMVNGINTQGVWKTAGFLFFSVSFLTNCPLRVWPMSFIVDRDVGVLVNFQVCVWINNVHISWHDYKQRSSVGFCQVLCKPVSKLSHWLKFTEKSLHLKLLCKVRSLVYFIIWCRWWCVVHTAPCGPFPFDRGCSFYSQIPARVQACTPILIHQVNSPH